MCQRPNPSDDDGQTAAEYIGILFFLVAVIGGVLALAPGIGEAIGDFISQAIARMAGEG